MADIVESCANPGCTEPGTKQCSACKTTPYCGPICQTADWAHHKEVCPGHLRKMGMAHLAKADGFGRERNCPQTLHYANLALTKLNQLKDRSLALIEIINGALTLKFNALSWMGHNKEALECATERYNMWATNFMRNPRMIEAAFPLIQSLLFNNEFDKAHLIASTVHEMIMHPTTHDIPEGLQQPYLALSSRLLAGATLELVRAGGIPPEEKQKVGEEVTALARKALEIDTKLYGAEGDGVISSMSKLADVLNHFNDVDDEVLRLRQQVHAFYVRVGDNSSVNLAKSKQKLGDVYGYRAARALTANDLDRQLANLELTLPLYRESLQIYRAFQRMDEADEIAQRVTEIEEWIQQATMARTAGFRFHTK